MNVLCIDHEAERLGVADVGWDRRGNRLGNAGVHDPKTNDQEQFKEEYPTDHQTDRQIFQKTLAQLGEIDVEHHDHEQEKGRDRADKEKDENHPQKFGAHQHEQAGGVDERQDQKQHG